MIDEPLSRRAFLAASGTAFASVWLAADPANLRASLAHATRAQGLRACAWEFFTPEQAADFDAIAAHIIPTDDTPGAREAGVVHFIDHALATWAVQQREVLTRGLDDLTRRVNERWPDIGRFAVLSPGRQLVLLHAVERTPFFEAMRFATVAGMFSLPSYGGNVDKVGWRLIGFDDRHVWQPPFGYYDAEPASEGD